MHMSFNIYVYNFRPEMTKSVAWKDLPETVCIDRNKYDYGETELSLNDSLTVVEDILETFTKIHKLRNHTVILPDYILEKWALSRFAFKTF